MYQKGSESCPFLFAIPPENQWLQPAAGSAVPASKRFIPQVQRPSPEEKRAHNPADTAKGTETERRKSSPLGNIRVQNLLEGDHVLLVEKPGLLSQEISFVVTGIDTVRLEERRVVN